MIYYAKEIHEEEILNKTAGVKARDDVNAIFARKGWKEIVVPSICSERSELSSFAKILMHYKTAMLWRKKTAELGSGDYLFIQFPIMEHSLLFGKVVKELSLRGVMIVLIVHDLDSVRIGNMKDVSLARKYRIKKEEEETLLRVHKIIVHNDKMRNVFLELGYDADKLLVLEIFDYLIDDNIFEKMDDSKINKQGPVIVAGNLRKHKAGYAYVLPKECNYNLYGVGYDEIPMNNVAYLGSFSPDELPVHLSGSFGLVWDGPSANTCEGAFGEYLRINNPHKTSLFLASGIPVVIWSEAALAEFVERNNCGMVVSSLYEIKDRIDSLSDEEYSSMKYNAKNIAQALRNGQFLSKVAEEAMR